MTDTQIGVGIIGVQPGRSWGAVAHVPALRTLPQYNLVAISTTKADTARAAAAALDVRYAFDNHHDLATHPEVDLVVVAVKVPHHLELVTAALDAGKMVFCEWPLGNGLAEAIALADHAKRLGIRTAVGLQARAAPVFNYVRDLVRDGYLGQVLSTTLLGSATSWGAVMELPNAYTALRENGATVTTIPFGHAVDAVCYCLGEFTELSATQAVRRQNFTVAETGETRPMTSADQVVVSGLLGPGIVAAMHYKGGMSRGVNMLWEINGTEGDLHITAVAGSVQVLDLSLSGGRGTDAQLQPMAIPEKYFWAPPEARGYAFNLAQTYLRLAADLRDGTHLCPDFDDAVLRHRMLAGVEAAAASGMRSVFG